MRESESVSKGFSNENKDRRRCATGGREKSIYSGEIAYHLIRGGRSRSRTAKNATRYCFVLLRLNRSVP
jgi:hypothetical protein